MYLDETVGGIKIHADGTLECKTIHPENNRSFCYVSKLKLCLWLKDPPWLKAFTTNFYLFQSKFFFSFFTDWDDSGCNDFVGHRSNLGLIRQDRWMFDAYVSNEACIGTERDNIRDNIVHKSYS